MSEISLKSIFSQTRIHFGVISMRRPIVLNYSIRKRVKKLETGFRHFSNIKISYMSHKIDI